MEKKVLHLADLDFVGGIEVFLTDLLEKPVNGFTFFVFSPKPIMPIWQEKLKKSNVIYRQAINSHDWEPEVIQFVKEFEIDIVHFHYPWRGIKYDLKKAGVKLLIDHEHSAVWVRTPAQQLKQRLSQNIIDGIITVSEASRQMLIKQVGINPKKITTINSGINFQRMIVTNPIKRPEEKKIITTISRLVRLKGLSSLIKAIPFILNKQTNFEFWIIGDGPLQLELQQLVNTLGINEQVKFWGPQLNVSDFLVSTDLFILTSVQEALGLVFMEAGFWGLPSIASNVDGIPEIIVNGETGILIDQTEPVKDQKKNDHFPRFVVDGRTKKIRRPMYLSPQNLADTIIEVFNQPEKLQLMGEKARRRVHEFYNIDRCRNDIINYYTQKLQEKFSR